jgi:hypothetical protein
MIVQVLDESGDIVTPVRRTMVPILLLEDPAVSSCNIQRFQQKLSPLLWEYSKSAARPSGIANGNCSCLTTRAAAVDCRSQN